MRKTAAILIIAFLMILSLAGCGADRGKLQSEFNALIAGTATSENIYAIAEFLDENIESAGQDIASRMVFEYQEFLLDYISQNKDKTTIQELSVYFDADTGRIDVEKIKNSEFKSYYDDIKAGSLLVILCDSTPVLKVDYSGLLEKYGEYISESMQDLYRLEAQLIENPTSQNATLRVSWEELTDRTFAAEQIITKYSDDVHTLSGAMWIYTAHLNTMLMGTTNTPVFDYSTKEFSPSARAAYQDFMLSHPDTPLTWVLKEYFTYLNSIDYSLDFNDTTMSKVFFDTCDWLVSEAEKRVKE